MATRTGKNMNELASVGGLCLALFVQRLFPLTPAAARWSFHYIVSYIMLQVVVVLNPSRSYGSTILSFVLSQSMLRPKSIPSPAGQSDSGPGSTDQGH